MMDDNERIRQYEQASTPEEALKYLIEDWHYIGTDPYYREMNNALDKMANRIYNATQKKVIGDG